MPGVRRVWLVRHGESTWNERGLVQGQQTLPVLTAAGLRQASRCAASLLGEPVRAVYSSDLRRALETAAPIARALGLDVRHEPRMRERALGAAEGTSSALLAPERSGIAAGRVIDADAAPDGGETVRQLYERATTCASELLSAHEGDEIVLVCHGGVIRVLLAWLDAVPPCDMAWPEIANAVPIVRSVATPVPTG